MKIGTKSLLFGVHNIIWHPITVIIAWIKLYHKFPSFKELICILIHDIGYFGCANMDGQEGQAHPEAAAKIVKKWGAYYYELCLYHSRHYAHAAGAEPSKLCWADKLSIAYDPYLFYITRPFVRGIERIPKRISNM
jgi:hypothetical protein